MQPWTSPFYTPRRPYGHVIAFYVQRALPSRLGGIGLLNPTKLGNEAFAASIEVTRPIVKSILNQEGSYSQEVLSDQLTAAAETRKKNRALQSATASDLKSDLTSDLQRAMDLAQEKGASNWLTVLPVEEFGFSLHKGAFRDALALRYGWPLQNIPTTCACGKNFNVEHALSCAKGGYTSIRHNEIRDHTAHLMTELCHNVVIEPHLQPLNGETLYTRRLFHHPKRCQTGCCSRRFLGQQV